MTHYPAHSRIYNIKSDSLDTPKINTVKQHSAISKNVTLSSSMHENSNSLIGLLAHYDSDSEHEEVNGKESNKLDAKVDDFLQEINKIVPSESNQPGGKDLKKRTEKSCAWQECFDESTGYPYYWNMGTNAVTWEMPEEYKIWLSRTTNSETKPPDEKPAVEEQKKTETNCVKIKIPPPEKERPAVQTKQTIRKPQKKKIRKQSSDSEDEKIVMITSFSEESSSESDIENNKDSTKKEETTVKAEPKIEQTVVMGPHIEDIPKDPEVVSKKEIIENIKEENIDETIILARLRTQAKVLHELGGELPKSLDKSIIADLPDACKPQSLALVAGYGDDSDPEEEHTIKSLFPIPIPEPETTNEQSQSTLFPAVKPVDVKQFELPTSKPPSYTTPKEVDSESLVDNKVFKRKKRLGVAFDVPKLEKRAKTSEGLVEELGGEGRKGFGFQTETNMKDNESKPTGFVKSGIAFVKADTLNPAQSEQKSDGLSDNEGKLEDFEGIKAVVSEKVSFLGEGKDPVSAVQVMAIQLQTLELAYKAGGLTQKYLSSWLRETFVDLEKLEQEAAPDGWQCQWDRSLKRYFYRNASSGEWQWEFPVDIVGGGEAMDICTTPPPTDEGDPPPQCSPTPPPPPPPPIISAKDHKRANKQTDEIQPPIPSAPPPIEVTPPPPPIISVSENQPLPPGVDSPDLPFFASKLEKEPSTKAKDSLGSELDSFYSDIALLEAATTTSGSGTEAAKSDTENVPSPPSIADSTSCDAVGKKKKKSKSKLGQGINMKKKAVSTLVEKWKKVQNDYL